MIPRHIMYTNMVQIKCDETKPSCERCVDKGLTCPGFPPHPNLRWSAKHEVFGCRRSPARTRKSLSQESLKASPELHKVRRETCPSQIENAVSRLNPEKHEQQLSPTDSSVSEEIPREHITSEILNIHQAEVIDDRMSAEHISSQCESGETRGVEPVPPGLAWTVWWQPFDDTIIQEYDIMNLTKCATRNPLVLDFPSDLNVGLGPLDETEDDPVSETSSVTRTQPPLHLIHLDTELVEAYFSIVCPIFSTFDSQHNQFRTFVAEKWQSSMPIYYAILSMAAAKLSWQTPTIKVYALEYQSMALNALSSGLSSSSAGEINTELLFVILLLGLSACWHDISDLGTLHLRALQHAITPARWPRATEPKHLEFFRDALVYWQMVACLVDDEVPLHDYFLAVPSHRHQQRERSTRQSFVAGTRITPHPWAGVATAPQATFARIVRHIRALRSFDLPATESSALLNRPGEFLRTLDTLEEELSMLELPQLHEIANIGDENTPAIHHLLLAEAYMFACLYQLYYTFPYLRRKRIRRILAAEEDHVGSPIGRSWSQSQTRLWSSILRQGEESGADEWLNFLGTSVITRLEQVQITSGTSCVQALLLLVGAGSLSVRPELHGTDAERDILQSRRFVLDRISALSNKMLSVPLLCVKEAVCEIFKRLDLGINVFWMDVLQSMGIVTIIG